MPRLPITEDRGAAGDQAAGGSGVPVDSSDYDEMLGVHTLFVVVPRAEVVYFRLVVESWEDIAVVRTPSTSTQSRARPLRHGSM